MGAIEAHATITVVPQFTQLATGPMHGCGITGRAEIYCWGRSVRGELGTASALQDCAARFGPGALCSGLPVRSVNLRASAIVAGLMFTCALDASGRASCWGSNVYGEIGAGSITSDLVLTPVAGGYQFTQLVAGRSHACGITTARDAYCWGLDYSGALGAGDVSPERCSGDPCSRRPRLVAGGHQWAQLSATDRATCGVTTSNELYCWGLDIGGSDGLYCQNATNLVGCTRTPIRIAAAHGYKATGIGNVHRCQQRMNGSLDCWGANYFGMLGNGTLNGSATPTAVSGGTPYASFVAGRTHTCALTSDGRVQCWGLGTDGQVGNGALQNALVPTDVAGGHRFTALVSSGNSDFNCALDDKGRAYCWGHGDLGQLGDGIFVTHSEPAPVRLIPVL
jgi:alpha-tubulin suppressor-like RCC1 family protein